MENKITIENAIKPLQKEKLNAVQHGILGIVDLKLRQLRTQLGENPTNEKLKQQITDLQIARDKLAEA